jgi:hypothetical protein
MHPALLIDQAVLERRSCVTGNSASIRCTHGQPEKTAKNEIHFVAN